MNKLPILTFHSLDVTGSVISMPPSTFRRIMEDLAAAGWRGCTVSEALAAHEIDRGPQRLVALSFDDGFENVLEEAFPVLRDLEFTATVFAIAGRCGEDNRWPGQPSSIPTLRLLDWDGLGALLQAGWEIGSHGLEHARLTTLNPQEVAAELEGAQDLLESRLDTPVSLFAYPYGTHDRAVRDLTRAVYAGACGTRLALASDADVEDRFSLPRIDAYYLRRFSAAATIDSLPGRAYLALRRGARRLRHGEG